MATTVTNAATSIMSGIISGNSSFGGGANLLGNALLAAVQNLPFGG